MSAEPEFENMLEDSADLGAPKRGELRTGRVVALDEQGLIVDLGLKRDGVVPRADVLKLTAEGMTFEPGQDLPVMILSPEDSEGNLIVSVHLARRSKDWLTAEQYLASGEIFEAQVVGYNRGGLIVPFGDLRAFVPASHHSDLPRGLTEEARHKRLTEMVGKKFPFKVIEVDADSKRLVLSQREAFRGWRELQKGRLLSELAEGQVRKGVVSGLRDFGAFVDLGGADGLIHISELSWRRVKHPREVLRVGQEVEVQVVKLDPASHRIGLSLKKLQPDPWLQVAERYAVGDVIPGRITRVAPFGAFVELEDGIEGLVPNRQTEGGLSSLREGLEVQVRVVRLELDRQRIGLALHSAEPPEEIEAAAPEQEDTPKQE